MRDLATGDVRPQGRDRWLRWALAGAVGLTLAGTGVARAGDDPGGPDPGASAGDTTGGDTGAAAGATGDMGGDTGADAGDAGAGAGDTGAMGNDAGANAGNPGDAGAAATAGTWTKGQLEVDVDLGLNLSSSLVAKPFSIAPDIWYTVSPKLRAVLGHSAQSMGGFYGTTVGSGICLTGASNGCSSLYGGGALGADYLATSGTLQLVPFGRLTFNGDSEFGAIVGADVMTKVAGGKLMIGGTPNIHLGFNKRDQGNKEVLTVPVYAMYAVSPKLLAGVETGIYGPLSGFGDSFAIPVSVGGMFTVNPHIQVGAAFAFYNLAGKNNTADIRALSILFGWTK